MPKRTKEIFTSTPRISEQALSTINGIRTQEEERREVNISLWKDIASVFNPDLSDWDTETDTSDSFQPDYRSIGDNVGIKSSKQLTDGVSAYAFSRSSAWARLAAEDEEVMESADNKKWLQRMEVHCQRQMDKGGWYDAAWPFVRTGVDFATAVMFRFDNPKRGLPAYQNLHLKNVAFMENEFGDVDVLFRSFWLSPDLAASVFGYERLPQTIQEAYSQGLTKRFKFTQAIFPTDRFDLDIERRQSKGMPFYSVYVADIERTRALREGGYWTFPAFVWRFSRSSTGSQWGTDSPGYLEVANVKQLGGMRKDFHRMVQQKARPPMKVSDTIQSLHFEPNGITRLRPGQDYAPGIVIGDLSGLMDDMRTIQDGVRDTYHRNLFLVMTQNIERLKTATEVEAIKGEQAAMLTAFFGRLSTEFLERHMEDLVQLEMDTGRAPPPPRGMRQRMLKVDLVSPLAILQKKYLLLDTTRQFINEVAQLAQIYPEGMDNVDFNVYLRHAAEIYHVDQDVLRDIADVQRIQEARAKLKAKQMQQEMEAQAAESQAKVYAAGAKAPEAGSPGEKMVAAAPAIGRA
jgi:hypothetical protein